MEGGDYSSNGLAFDVQVISPLIGIRGRGLSVSRKREVGAGRRWPEVKIGGVSE